MSIGIYIHLPLCLARCPYCDFYSQTNAALEPAIIDAIVAEIRLVPDLSNTEKADTIYLGGGTPSCFASHHLAHLLSELRHKCALADPSSLECTIEINPDDLNAQKLAAYYEMGINRVSLGTQSFIDRELVLLGRRHDSTRNFEAVELIKKSQINNFSLDLIFGLPGQSLQDFTHNLETALELQPKHISLYCLTFEKGTKFHDRRESGKMRELSSEIQNRMYLQAAEILETAGFRQYEISNFALPGYESRHNLNYWNLGKYLGLGPSAHSYIGITRSANVADIHEYIHQLENQVRPIAHTEEITQQTRVEELILLSLRQPAGLDLETYQEFSGHDLYESKQELIDKLIERKLAVIADNRLKLTLSGYLVVDEIISALI